MEAKDWPVGVTGCDTDCETRTEYCSERQTNNKRAHRVQIILIVQKRTGCRYINSSSGGMLLFRQIVTYSRDERDRIKQLEGRRLNLAMFISEPTGGRCQSHAYGAVAVL